MSKIDWNPPMTLFCISPMSVITTFYTIPIPEPRHILDLQQMAQITTPDGVVDVHWVKKTSQVVIHFNDEWHIQPNGRIDESIGNYLGYNVLDMKVSSMFLFDREFKNGKSAPEDMQKQLLGCEWSDYALDKMVFQVKLDVYGMEPDTFDFLE
jgi:hypothetical protein